jgi:hypothetical protein
VPSSLFILCCFVLVRFSFVVLALLLFDVVGVACCCVCFWMGQTFIFMRVPTVATIVAHPCFQRGGTGMIARELFSTDTYIRKYRGEGACIFSHFVLFCFGVAYFCVVGLGLA